MTDNHCVICGQALPKGRRLYCSEPCADEAERRRASMAAAGRQRPPLVRERVCMDCGMAFVGAIRSKRCPSCQAEADKRHDAEYRARRRAGHARTIGSEDVCEVCGRAYTVNSGAQRWCKDCAAEATRRSCSALNSAWNRRTYSDPQRREEKNRGKRLPPKEKVCARCGTAFASNGNGIYCSEACRTAARRAYWREYDETRRKR